MRYSLPLLLVYLASACGAAPGLRADKDTAESCGGYPALALYRLPWNAAETHTVVQSNCAAHTNKGVHRYGYDFAMTVGTSVLAARAGTVTSVVQGFLDGSTTGSNTVKIRHADATTAVYQSLQQDSATVVVGDYVAAGLEIALSGQTGFVTQPLLHFEVTSVVEGLDESLPISFTNAGTAVTPLLEGTAYPVAAGGLRDEP